jgi:glycosyltransferase involved in cell wall biosynthesis
LVLLAKGLASRGHAVAVAVFFCGGVYETELASTGVRVIDLGKNGRWDILAFLFRLIRFLRKEHPALLHSYLGVPNILSAVLKPLLPGTRIVWGVRASNVDLAHYDWLSRLAFGLECRLARFADLIIANSASGKRYAVEHGFPENKTVMVHNGIDTEYFRFYSEGRRLLRVEWGVDEHEILVGLVGRLDPMKDHPVFLEAASRISHERQDIRFVCVGGGPADYADALKQHALALGLTHQLLWVGARDDMPAIYSALDIATSSSSFGEGFSNSIAEAMACGVPCVVTDVGDSAHIVGDTGAVVRCRDANTLAEAIQQLAFLSANERVSLGESGRLRIVSEFGVDGLIRRAENLLGLV